MLKTWGHFLLTLGYETILFSIAKVLGVGMRKATLWDRAFTAGTGTAGVALHVVLDDHSIRCLTHHTSMASDEARPRHGDQGNYQLEHGFGPSKLAKSI